MFKKNIIYIAILLISIKLSGMTISVPQKLINAPRKDVRALLYAMEHNLSMIEDIQRNKAFYRTVLAQHIAHVTIKKKKKMFLLQALRNMTCTACIVNYGFTLLDWFCDGHCYKKFAGANVIVGCCAAIMIAVTHKVDAIMSEHLDFVIERDKRIIEKLNQL